MSSSTLFSQKERPIATHCQKKEGRAAKSIRLISLTRERDVVCACEGERMATGGCFLGSERKKTGLFSHS